MLELVHASNHPFPLVSARQTSREIMCKEVIKCNAWCTLYLECTVEFKITTLRIKEDLRFTIIIEGLLAWNPEYLCVVVDLKG